MAKTWGNAWISAAKFIKFLAFPPSGACKATLLRRINSVDRKAQKAIGAVG
jgi:hypothetical protein